MKRRTARLGLTLTLGLSLLLVPSASGPQTISGPIGGRTATPLPDGRWLLLGGEGTSGPVGTALIWEPRTGASTPLPQGLQHPRAWHTATVTPDGTILILGGVGAGGQVVDAVEVFDELQKIKKTGKVETLTKYITL